MGGIHQNRKQCPPERLDHGTSAVKKGTIDEKICKRGRIHMVDTGMNSLLGLVHS